MQKKLMNQEYQDIDLKLIDEPDGRIRLTLDQEAIESLADNIREVGQIQPISLAVTGKRYEIIAGHLRYMAIKSLGRKTIKAIVKTLERKEIALIRASENLKRTNLTPIEEGATYKDLITEYGLTRKEVAVKFGIAPSMVGYKMDLLKLNPMIQKLIHAGKIYTNVGIELNKIDDERELKRNLNDAVKNGCTIDTARLWVDDYRKSLSYEDMALKQGSPPEPVISIQKVYQTCELCQKPVEVEDMRILRICPDCYNTIASNLKKGGE